MPPLAGVPGRDRPPFRLRLRSRVLLMRNVLAIGLTGILGIGVAAVAANVKPEEAVEYRQSVYTVIRWNFKPIGDMVKGQIPFDAAAVARHAAFLEMLSKMPLEGFVPGSDVGETEAKPEIWKNWSEFEGYMRKFQEETAKLSQAAKTGDPEAIKTQFNNTAKACKNCHDKFRKEE